MNRTIKFRVWSLKKKTFSLPNGAFFIRSDGELELQKASFGGTYNDETCYCSTNYPKNDGYVIQQFTGLKDKTGKEIFEGDILHVNGSKNPHFEVRFNTGGYGVPHGFNLTRVDNVCLWWLDESKTRNYKVIGNIFENPELLKK